MIITSSDFTVRPYKIINLEENKDFADFRDYEEAKILKKILGLDLYDQFVAGIGVNPIDAKWSSLRAGGIYEYTSKNYTYEGMLAFLKPYIYAMWLRATYDKHTASGIVISKPTESEVISPATRICNAYRDFQLQVGSSQSMKGTLYGYLHVNNTTYEDWAFEDPGGMNVFNL